MGCGLMDAGGAVDYGLTGVAVSASERCIPWQCGSNENTNGLLRQNFPKTTDLAGLTQADLDQAATRSSRDLDRTSDG